MKKLQILQPVNQPKSEEMIESEDIPKSIFEKKDIPLIKFNTKNLLGLEEKLQSLKLCNYQSDFLKEIQIILNLYSHDELKYNAKFVLYVMMEVEKFLLKPKAGKSKKELVIECVKPYFNDDPDLVSMVIDLVFDKLPQIKFWKRQGYKLVRYFLKVRQNQQ